MRLHLLLKVRFSDDLISYQGSFSLIISQGAFLMIGLHHPLVLSWDYCCKKSSFIFFFFESWYVLHQHWIHNPEKWKFIYSSTNIDTFSLCFVIEWKYWAELFCFKVYRLLKNFDWTIIDFIHKFVTSFLVHVNVMKEGEYQDWWF